MKHLPDFGVDIFIRVEGEVRPQIARLAKSRAVFLVPTFSHRQAIKQVPIGRVQEWDYAVMAGDIL